MGFRFQRRVTLFPGVRLNFSRSGISTTIGRPGASITIGGRGRSALNLGIPGTGISFRQSLAPSEAPTTPAPGRSPDPPPGPLPLLDGSEIRSADVAEVTSEGLGELKALYMTVAARRRELRASIPHAETQLARAEARLRRSRHWFLKLFIGGKEPERAAALEQAIALLKNLETELAGAFVDADLGVDAPVEEGFEALASAFRDASECARIWDVTAARSEDRRVTRSAASLSVARELVRFSRAEPDDTIQTSADPLRLSNANGADLLVYPGFILLRSGSDVAFVDVREVAVSFARRQFVEDEEVPADSQVVGNVWLKSNKDGSPDRRFANNRQIPVALYGEMTLASREGLNEEYLFSNVEKAERFATALRAFQALLPALRPSAVTRAR